MKKVFCVLLLVCAGTGMVFAQEKAAEGEAAAPKERKNTVTLDTISLTKGFIASDFDVDTFFFCIAAGYERQVAPRFTVGAQLDLFPGTVYDNSYMYFALAAMGRYYPMTENMEKFFLGTVFGFNVESIEGDTSFAGLLVGLEAGYKLALGKSFSIEPSMAYIYSKSGGLGLFSGASVAPLGWKAGLRLGLTF